MATLMMAGMQSRGHVSIHGRRNLAIVVTSANRLMYFALLLTSCSVSSPETGDSVQCGPDLAKQDGCPIDTCAMTCSSIAEGIDCCIEAHGRGSFDTWNQERLDYDCYGAECDSSNYLSPKAALCVGQVHGLGSGIGWCGATFDFGGGEATWMAASTVVNECIEEGRELGDVGYQVVRIEARTGDYMDRLEQIGLAECPDE